jgi:hypothetical protein
MIKGRYLIIEFRSFVESSNPVVYAFAITSKAFKQFPKWVLADYLCVSRAASDSQARNRKPFVTEKGYLGLGPVHLQPGDSVAIFGGAAVPFVLRERADKTYQLIGEAYIDKIIDGEAVASSKSPR